MAKRKKSLKTIAVPLSGSTAYTLGFSAADCPHQEGTPEFERWNYEWDQAADIAEQAKQEEHTDELESSFDEPAEDSTEEAASEVHDEGAEDSVEGDVADGEEPAERSVVKAEYRARYAEAGHPQHCGDELAVLLNNLCLPKKGAFDIARFETICNANGVDLTKYNRSTNGWQGRLRMTGRNLLSAKVHAAGGIIRTPVEAADPEYKLSAEWMASRTRSKNNA